MSQCIVCRGKRLGKELVDKVFDADGRYVLVTGIPSTVCHNCGERAFSRGATERARLLVHDPTEATPRQVGANGGVRVSGIAAPAA